jgi:hypothetical protein
MRAEDREKVGFTRRMDCCGLTVIALSRNEYVFYNHDDYLLRHENAEVLKRINALEV